MALLVLEPSLFGLLDGILLRPALLDPGLGFNLLVFIVLLLMDRVVLPGLILELLFLSLDFSLKLGLFLVHPVVGDGFLKALRVFKLQLRG